MSKVTIALIVVAVLIILFFIYDEDLLDSTKSYFSSMFNHEKKGGDGLLGESEMLDNPKAMSNTPFTKYTKANEAALGMTGNLPWDEVIKATELDPATFINQQEFVKDVRIFSSGANFTSVSDSDNSNVFVNFVGLARPQAYIGMIGGSARQVPDVDESVLARNMYPFRRYFSS